MAARNIDEVIIALDEIIVDAKSKQSRLGYFPALYRQVTLRVKQGIAEGLFDDGPRMDALDTAFANRYLEAVEQFQRGEKPTRSWKVAFEFAENPDSVVLQHLLLGINAHINLDLGVSAAMVAPGPALPSLADDFRRINDILSSMIDPAQGVLGKFSPMLDLLDRLGGSVDERLIDFSMEEARKDAWAHAVLLAGQSPENLPLAISSLDRKVAFLARLVSHPKLILARALELICWRESDDVVAIIEALAQVEPTPN